MKVLIEVRHADTLNAEFVDCQNCAVARAVKRVVRAGLYISEGVCCINIGSHTIPHTPFGVAQFGALNRNPDTMHILEMDIPEEYLSQDYLNNAIPTWSIKGVKL